MGLFSSFIESVTGGISSVVGAVAGGVTSILGAAAPIIQTIAPLAAPIVGGFFQSQQQQQLLQLLMQQGGASGVAAGNLLQQQQAVGTVGSQVTSANPISRAQFFPPFDVNRLPSRPVFGAIQTQLARFPQFQFPQTTSFRQQGFGAAVSPGFRPFTPSFRSGQLGTQGQFVPGIAQGFDPRLGGQFARPPAPVRPFGAVFNRFGGFGF